MILLKYSMNFLITVTILIVFEGTLIYYLVNTKYFLPFSQAGDLELFNILFFLFLIASLLGLVISVCVFVVEKFLYCGRKEFPSALRSAKIGIISMVVLFVLFVLHVFHLLNFFVAILLIAFVIIGIMIIR